MDIVELSACVDCYMHAAGYRDGDQSATVAGLERIARDNGASIELTPEDGEPHFSWSRCEVCLSRLGGDRYRVSLVVEPEGATRYFDAGAL